MAWTSPRTYTVGEIITKSILDTHVRDNLRYIKGTDGTVTLDSGIILPDGAGFYIHIPNLTTTQRDALTPTAGMLIYNSTTTQFNKYENGAWKPVWVDGTANETIRTAIASPVFAYRLWYGASSKMNWQALDRSRRNPLKTTTSYATSSIYVSPWFNADWEGIKVALAIRALALGTTADETIAIKYRIDKVATDILTWTTTLDTLVLADAGIESITKFGSSAGLAFKTIQFGVDFARSTATSTPKLLYLTLEYERIITPKWGWSFVVDCNEEYNGKSPSVLLDAIVTAAETATLVTFYYGSVAKYVRVKSVDPAERLTGNTMKGQYSIFVVEK